jgi:hypothetical protein
MSSEIKVDTISENTSANGVAIDSVTLKDGAFTATAGSTITTSGNEKTLSLISTDADASHGPYIRMFRNSSSAADEDLVGRIDFANTNDAQEEENYLMMYSRIEDASNGNESGKFYLDTMVNGTSTSRIYMKKDLTVFNEDSGDIDFRVESNNQSHAIFVNSGTDRVGILEDSPDATLHMKSSENTYSFKVENAHASSPYGMQVLYSADDPDSGSDNFFFVGQAYDGSSWNVRFVVYGDGDVKNHDNSYGAYSDERIKQNITDANSQWNDIKSLKVRNFKRKDDVRKYGEDKAKVQIGLVAQELESVCPKLVDEAKPNSSDVLSSSEFGTLYEDGDTIPEGKAIGDVKEEKENVKGIKYTVLYMKAIKALQEAMTRIETLEAEVTALKGE